MPRHDNGFAPTTRLGKPHTVQGLRSAGLRHLGCNRYDLRHTFSQMCIGDRESDEVVSALLGHKTSKMVWTYAKIRNRTLAERASKLKLWAAG